jgi:hypothetical protein
MISSKYFSLINILNFFIRIHNRNKRANNLEIAGDKRKHNSNRALTDECKPYTVKDVLNEFNKLSSYITRKVCIFTCTYICTLEYLCIHIYAPLYMLTHIISINIYML